MYDAARLPSASVVVVSYNTAAHIVECIDSILALDYPRIEIIVVDNASSDGSQELIRSRFPKVELVELPDNRGFAGGASVGLFMAGGDIVSTVNPDVRLERSWMRVVAAALGDPDTGVVGSRILYPDGVTLQHAGGIVHYPLATTEHIGRGEHDEGQYSAPRKVSFVTGAALAMRREVGRALNFFDDDYYPLYYEDVDLCWRAEKEGLSTIYRPDALAFHKETVTLDRKGALYYSFYHTNRLRFVTKHFTPEQLMSDFLPAEAARISGDLEAEDRRSSLDLLDNPAVDLDSVERLNGAPPVRSLMSRWQEMKEHVEEVIGRWQVYEEAHGKPPEHERIGGRAGNLVNRFYLWPALQKQIEYNGALARAVRALAGQLAELQARVAVQSTLTSALLSREAPPAEDLSIELEDLRARVEQLEREMEQARGHRPG